MQNDLTKELLPLWRGERVYRESVMFIGQDDRAPLLYTPKSVLCVTSYDGDTVYAKGKDFICENGYISLCEGSRIPYIEETAYYHNDPSSLISIPHQGKDTFIYWGEGTTMTRWQIAVTYTHADEPIKAPPCRAEHFARFLGKMARGEDVTVLFYGDSITKGANSSYACETPPFLPPWSMLCTEYLARKHGYTEHFVNTGLEPALVVPSEDLTFGDRGNLTFINTAVGGWTSANGLENLEERVLAQISQHGCCDLFVLAFGMNDKRMTTAEHIANVRAMVDRVLAAAPETCVLLVSPMWPNPDSARWCITQPLLEPLQKELAAEYAAKGVGCAVAPMTTMSRQVLDKKRFCDYSGNNINHPNDFMGRLYAQTALQTLIGL